MKRGLPVFVLCLSLLVQATLAQGGEQSKKKITGIDDLPRRNYEVPGTVTELLTDDGAFAFFAAKVRADVEADLVTYEIEDRTTLRNFYGVLLDLDMLEGNYDHALQLLDTIRELHDK